MNNYTHDGTSSSKKPKLVSKKSTTAVPLISKQQVQQQQQQQHKQESAVIRSNTNKKNNIDNTISLGGKRRHSSTSTSTTNTTSNFLKSSPISRYEHEHDQNSKRKKVVLGTKGVQVLTTTTTTTRPKSTTSLSSTGTGTGTTGIKKQVTTSHKSTVSKKKYKPTERSITSILLLSQRNNDYSGSGGSNNSALVNDTTSIDYDNDDCTCYGCIQSRCNQCTLCEESGFLYNTCILKTCYNNRDYDTEQNNYNEICNWLYNSNSTGSTSNTTSSNNNTTNVNRYDNDILEIGTRVYCAWNHVTTDNAAITVTSRNTINNTTSNSNATSGSGSGSGWYWGYIIKKYSMKRNFSTKMIDYYTIQFDDGDNKKNVDRDEVWSEYKYKLLTEKLRLESLVPSPIRPIGIGYPETTTNNIHINNLDQSIQSVNSNTRGMSMSTTNKQLLLGEGNGEQQQQQQQQELVLPKGLSLVNPNSRYLLLNSIQSILVSDNDDTTTTTATTIHNNNTNTNHNELITSWMTNGCGRCINCRRIGCSKCNLCRTSNNIYCYHKMCLKISTSTSSTDQIQSLVSCPLLSTVLLPIGWKFCFTTTVPLHTQWKGLLLIAPSLTTSTSSTTRTAATKQFRSLGRAVHTLSNQFYTPLSMYGDDIEKETNNTKENDSTKNIYYCDKIKEMAKKFYSYVGLDDVPDTLLNEIPKDVLLNNNNNNNSNNKATTVEVTVLQDESSVDNVQIMTDQVVVTDSNTVTSNNCEQKTATEESNSNLLSNNSDGMNKNTETNPNLVVVGTTMTTTTRDYGPATIEKETADDANKDGTKLPTQVVVNDTTVPSDDMKDGTLATDKSVDSGTLQPMEVDVINDIVDPIHNKSIEEEQQMQSTRSIEIVEHPTTQIQEKSVEDTTTLPIVVDKAIVDEAINIHTFDTEMMDTAPCIKMEEVEQNHATDSNSLQTMEGNLIKATTSSHLSETVADITTSSIAASLDTLLGNITKIEEAASNVQEQLPSTSATSTNNNATSTIASSTNNVDTAISVGMVRRSSSNGSTVMKKDEFVYSTKRELGARVYSKYYNNKWYWGKIIDIVSDKTNSKYTVRYDDGEAVVNVEDYNILPEIDYNIVTKLPIPIPAVLLSDKEYDSCIGFSSPETIERVKLPLTELFVRRCKSCPSCLKNDCERCMICNFNKLCTSPRRQVCFFKICDRIANWEKMQPVPGLPVGWNFFISNTDDGLIATKNFRCHHPDLIGLRIVSPDGKRTHRSMEEAIKDSGVGVDDSRECIVQFYETLLGIKPRRERSMHELIGHGYHREWVDGTGKHREVYGTIITCWESMFAKEIDIHFSVRYDPEARAVLNSTSMCHLTVPEIDDTVQEAIAWSGFLSFTRKIGMSAIDKMVVQTAPFHFNWIVPTFRYPQTCTDSDLKSVVMFTKGFRIELVAKTSSIPNSGLGLWVRCTPASEIIARNESIFELQPGDAVDLGCYAPTDNVDRRPEHVNLIKAFIHDWECESWCFEMSQHQRGNDIFDITDDLSGDLHEKASQNIVVYANETDGKEVATIFAEHDPEGAVHYFLGHRYVNDGPFRLPTNGEAVELKVDYGPKYENVRYRKGYTRLSPEAADELKDKLKQDDGEVLEEIQEISANDLFDIIAFLENLVKLSSHGDIDENGNKNTSTTGSKLPAVKLIRALVVAMSIHQRFIGILKEFVSYNTSHDDDNSSNKFIDTYEFCNNGYTDMKQNNALNRSRQVAIRFVEQFTCPEQLKESFRSDDVFEKFVCSRIGVKSLDSTITPAILQSKLLALLQ